MWCHIYIYGTTWLFTTWLFTLSPISHFQEEAELILGLKLKPSTIHSNQTAGIKPSLFRHFRVSPLHTALPYFKGKSLFTVKIMVLEVCQIYFITTYFYAFQYQAVSLLNQDWKWLILYERYFATVNDTCYCVFILQGFVVDRKL